MSVSDAEVSINTRFRRLLIAIIVLNIVDLIITMYPSFGYGPLIEANPILLRIYAIAPFLLIVYKVAMGFVIAGVMWLCARYANFKATYWTTVAIVALFCLVTVWNLVSILK